MTDEDKKCLLSIESADWTGVPSVWQSNIHALLAMLKREEKRADDRAMSASNMFDDRKKAEERLADLEMDREVHIRSLDEARKTIDIMRSNTNSVRESLREAIADRLEAIQERDKALVESETTLFQLKRANASFQAACQMGERESSRADRLQDIVNGLAEMLVARVSDGCCRWETTDEGE